LFRPTTAAILARIQSAQLLAQRLLLDDFDKAGSIHFRPRFPIRLNTQRLRTRAKPRPSSVSVSPRTGSWLRWLSLMNDAGTRVEPESPGGSTHWFPGRLLLRFH